MWVALSDTATGNVEAIFIPLLSREVVLKKLLSVNNQFGFLTRQGILKPFSFSLDLQILVWERSFDFNNVSLNTLKWNVGSKAKTMYFSIKDRKWTAFPVVWLYGSSSLFPSGGKGNFWLLGRKCLCEDWEGFHVSVNHIWYPQCHFAMLESHSLMWLLIMFSINDTQL